MESLIYDENEVKEFIDKVLMPLEDDEVYLLLLVARKKWCKSISRSEEVLSRDIIRENELEKPFKKIKKMAYIDGMYLDRNTLKEIDIGCQSLYMVLDPRSTLKAYSEFISDINKWVYESFKGTSKNLELYRKLDLKLFSAIHKNRSRSLYKVIDIDKKDETILANILALLKGHVKCISETHGGYHIIVNRNAESSRIIYLEITDKKENVEILNDPITVIPGTLQGGFRVKRYNRLNL